jgi:uncharacterized protein
MDQTIADHALEYYASHSSLIRRKKVGFYGGEPLLELDLIQFVVEKAVAAFGRDDVVFFATTNGTLGRTEILSFLAQAGFRVFVSVDGPRRVHDRFRVAKGGSGTWEHAIRFVRQLQEHYGDAFWGKVGLSITIADPIDLEDARDFFATDPTFSRMFMHVGLVDWSRSVTKCNPRLETAVLGQSYLDLYCEQVVRGGDEDRFISSVFDPLLHHIWARSAPLTGQLWPGGSCIPGAKRLFVSTTGVFFPCERVGIDFALGDCHDGISLESVVGYLNDLIHVMGTICNSCWARRLCSICLANARWEGRVDPQRIRGLCGAIRRQLSFLLSGYLSVNETSADTWARRFRQEGSSVVTLDG